VPLLLLFLLLFVTVRPAICQDATVTDLQTKINEYTQKLSALAQAKDTLANQVNYLSSQIELTALKINQTETSIKILEKEIQQLTVEIGKLDVSLNQLTTNFISQVVQSYKLQKRIPPLSVFLNPSFNSFYQQYKYLSTAQANSRELMFKLETTRTNFDIQKATKQKKQQELSILEKQLADQKVNLANQKASKNNLLITTKNDEAKYQQLKRAAENELSSLLAAKFVGKRHVAKGEALGLMGNTGYSFGDHLHFGLYDLREENLSSWTYQRDIDPLDYLAQHRWPMDGINSINQLCAENNRTSCITQKRGQTPYSYLYADRFHHGIDMVSSSKTVFAINEGEAYFYRDNKSSLGNHVKLFHPDGKMSLYLHLQ